MSSQAQAAPVPILLDTDLGTDPDDALALAFLARDPGCRLLGVTTVNGDTRRRAALAQALLDLAGAKDVPVGAGARVAISGRPSYSMPVGIIASEPLAELPPALPTAEDVIVEVLRTTTQPVHVCGAGAYTNLASVLLAHPELHERVAVVHLMGGCLRSYALTPSGSRLPAIPEFNLNGDAVASAICLGLPRPIRLVPLDVTNELVLAPEDRATIAASGPLGAALGRHMDAWLRFLRSRSSDPELAQVRLHDPLAAVGIVDPAVEERVESPLSLRGNAPHAFLVESPFGRPVSVACFADAPRLRNQLVRAICGGATPCVELRSRPSRVR